MEMEVEAAPLELLCAVWVVRHGVAAERVAGGTAVSVVVADVVAGVRRWAVDDVDKWFHGTTSLEKAGLVGSAEALQFCLGEMATTQRQKEANWVLSRSALRGKLAAVQWLVDEAGADLHADVDYALLQSAEEGHVDVVRWLVAKGADVHADDDRALLWSACKGHLPVVRFLVEEGGADVHAGGDRPLRGSATFGRLAVVQWLVEEGGADVNADEARPLYWSAQNGRLAVVRFLVGEAGADPHARDDEVLRVCAGSGRLNVVEWLLSPESGVDWTAAAVRRAMEDVDSVTRDVLQAAVDRLDPPLLLRRSKRQRRV